MLLKNKTAVITGCNRGIGKKILEVFSENGANIFACSRKIDNDYKLFIKELQNKYKNEIIPIEFDFSEESQVKESASKILLSKKPIDILVNNAGTIHTALFQMTSINKLKEVFEINFFTQTIFTQYILKSMIKNKKGNIIYISSTSGIDGNEGRSAYSSSKAAIIAQAKAMSKEVGIHNIRVNVIAPGLIETDMLKKNTKDEIIKEMVSNTSLKRIGQPNEIANTVLILSSDLSSFMTGQVIRVDGGM